MKTLYFDCFAGASGNMILGALVALGVDRNELIARLRLLDIAEFGIEFSMRDKSGIAAVHADVKVPHEHVHRHLHHIEKIINDSRLDEPVKARAVAIFKRLAAAEAKIHGVDVQKVHFHEVGAMDAIIDVVGACICFELLGIERFICSKIHVGAGFAKMAHGTFPIPPPAVAELLKDATIYSTEIQGELMTPTGAAIISTVCSEFGPMPELTVEKTAYGAGTRDYDGFPNVLRLIIGTAEATTQVAGVVKIEANLDDITPEIMGFVMEKAFENGALDCWFTAVQMKKNRPGTMISVLCGEADREKIVALLFRETTTIGVRFSKLERVCLDREISSVQTRFGEVPLKISKLGTEIVSVKPEFDKLREIANRENLSLRAVEAEVRKNIN